MANRFDLPSLIQQRQAWEAQADKVRPQARALMDEACTECGKPFDGDWVTMRMGDRHICVDCFLNESPAPVRVGYGVHQHVLPYLGEG